MKNSSSYVVNLYKKSELSSDIESLRIIESNAIRSRVEELLLEWKKEFESVDPKPKIIDTDESKFNNKEKSKSNIQPNKILSEIDIVIDNVQLLNDIVNNAKKFNEIKNGVTFQLVANLREMLIRLQQLIETVPEEAILLKALEAHEIAFSSLELYDYFKKNGLHKKSSVPKSNTINIPSSNQVPDVSLHASAPPASQLLDFSNISSNIENSISSNSISAPNSINSNFELSSPNNFPPLYYESNYSSSNMQQFSQPIYPSIGSVDSQNNSNLQGNSNKSQSSISPSIHQIQQNTNPSIDPFAAISQRNKPQLPPLYDNNNSNNPFE